MRSGGRSMNSDTAPDERVLHELFQTGAADWKGLQLSESVFQAHVRALHAHRGSRMPSSGLRAAELYLCCACAIAPPDATGERAIGIFVSQFLSRIPEHLARMRLAPEEQAEVVRRLEDKLLLRRPPGI